MILWGLFLDWFKHSALRFVSVIAIAAIIVGVPYLVYTNGYHAGYKKAILDRPTNTYTGTTTVIQAIAAQVIGISFGKHWAFGVIHQ